MRIARASRVVATAVLGILPLALASACGSSNSSTTPGSSGSKPEKTSLVVGAVPAETAAALYLAQERGIFAAHGLHVTVKPITSTLEIVPDMVHGSIDIASGQIPSFIIAQAQGVGSLHLLASGLTHVLEPAPQVLYRSPPHAGMMSRVLWMGLTVTCSP